MTNSNFSLWIPQHLPLKSPYEMVSWSQFSFQIYIAEDSIAQSDVILGSGFTIMLSQRTAFLTWISGCIATGYADLPGEFCPWNLDLMLTGLWGFTPSKKTRRLNDGCYRNYIKPVLDMRFNLHKLPPPTVTQQSTQVRISVICRQSISQSDVASCWFLRSSGNVREGV